MITWYENNLCDAGFVINLDKRTDRMESVNAVLQNISLNGVQRFPAVVVKDQNYVKYGCTQSHLDLYQKQLDNNWEYMLVLEDDILPSFFLDYNNNISNVDQKKYVTSLINSFNTLKPDLLWLGVRVESPVEEYDINLSYSKKTLMSHGYLCSKKLAKFCLNHLRYKESNHFSGGYPIDFFLSQISLKNCWRVRDYPDKDFLQNDLVITSSNILIFSQAESFSDLTDSHTSYSDWIIGCHNEYCTRHIKYKKELINEYFKN